MEAFAEAVAELHRMETVQVTAVLSGQDFPFDEWIAMASERVDRVKAALIVHRREHGCINKATGVLGL